MTRPPEPPPTSPSIPRGLRANAFAGRTVLIVDDDRSSIAFIRDGLASCGYAFTEAYDGSSALAMLRDVKPDLMLLDVEMPGLTGVEVCRIVKSQQGSGAFGFIPVILMTARGTGKVESLELGADDYLTKPIDLLELSARVKSMLRLKALQDELLAKCQDLDRMNQDLERKRVELERLSRVDPLTSLFNRRYFEERFRFEFARSQRYRGPLSCMMIDIDHFKQINDTRGHQAGDAALKQLAACVKASLRDVDLVARYGGEEFVAILPETNLSEGALVAERLRARVEGESFMHEHEREPIRLTISIGLACYPAAGIADPEGFLRVTDEALYRAKKCGRNRVERYEE